MSGNQPEKLIIRIAGEKQVQGWSHAKKKALIEGKLSELTELARKDFGRLDTSSASRYADTQLLDDQNSLDDRGEKGAIPVSE